MRTVLKFVEFLLGALVLVGVAPSAAYEDCNAFYVNGENAKTPGKCTRFQECPILFDILKSPYKTPTEIKLIQKLTCVPDNENPTVCCSVDDIVSETSNVDYGAKPSIQPGKQTTPDDGKIHFEVTRGTTVKPKVHPNFRLLPSTKECGAAVNSVRIIGGRDAKILDYPWLVRIGYYSYDDGEIKYLCAGTVINKRYILTAAHCTEEVDKLEFRPEVIRLGEPDAECDETWGCSDPVDIKIEKIIPHPDYNKRDKSNDIGLIRLAEDIPYANSVFISPVCLPFVEEYKLEKDIDPSLKKYFDTNVPTARVAGWGKTRWNDQEGSDILQYIALPIVSQTKCQKNYEHHARVTITEKQLCAGGEVGRDSCGGDSGGGLFIPQGIHVTPKVKRTLTFQFGVVSFGPTHCGVGDLPGVYSNIYAYKNWILDQLEE